MLYLFKFNFNLENGQVFLNYVKTLGFTFFVIVLSLISLMWTAIIWLRPDYSDRPEVRFQPEPGPGPEIFGQDLESSLTC